MKRRNRPIKRSIKIPIAESESDLQRLVTQAREGHRKERLQFLYWLKIGKIKTLVEAAQLLGHCRDTLSDWLAKYETGGLTQLLDRQKTPGRTPTLKGEILEKLKEQLTKSEGFNSYLEIQRWLEKEHQYEVSYSMVFRVCHYHLKASPKVPRPRNPKQDPAKVAAFKKTSLKKSKLSKLTTANI